MTFDDLKAAEIKPECKTRDCEEKAMADCDIPACDKKAYPNHRGYCQIHYRQQLKLLGKKARRGCSVKGCPNIHRACGMCSNHYNREYARLNPR